MRTGAMIPGQLGPTMRDLFWVLSMSVMRTMSGAVSLLPGCYFACWRIPCWGIPSVMVTIRGTSALMASSIPAAATGGLLGVRSCAVNGEGVARVRDEDGGRGSAGLLDALLDIGEDGEAEVLLAGLLGVGAADDLCACASVSIRLRVHAGQLLAWAWAHTVLDRLLRVEAAAALAAALCPLRLRRALTFPAFR